MILDAPINSARLILRNLGTKDIGQHYLDWMYDPKILRYLEVRFSVPRTIAELTEFVTLSNDSHKELLLGIYLRESKCHIGNIKLGPISRYHNRADLGFIIGEQSAWGKGYATEAIIAVTKFALTELKLDKVSAGCYAGNYGSARSLEKAGFRREGHLRGHWVVDGEREDGFIFGILANSHNEETG